MKYFKITLHWTHQANIKKLFKDGYSIDELALMYKVPTYIINRYTQAQQRPERI